MLGVNFWGGGGYRPMLFGGKKFKNVRKLKKKGKLRGSSKREEEKGKIKGHGSKM